MNTVKTVNFFGNPLKIFDTIYPVGVVYTQYPEQKSPNELWGEISTWQELNYNGAFFRAAGGKADEFNVEKQVTAVSGTVITVPDHGASVGCIVYDFEHNQSRTVVAVNGNNLTLDSVFTSANITFVLITQVDTNKSHNHTFHGSSTTTNDSSATNTGGMSANESGSYIYKGQTESEYVSVGGNISKYVVGDLGLGMQMITGGSPCGFTINVAHTHNMQHTHSLTPNGYNDNSGDVETRPSNYTIKLWKRVS